MGRQSRARWLAFGSTLATAGCSPGSLPTPPPFDAAATPSDGAGGGADDAQAATEGTADDGAVGLDAPGDTGSPADAPSLDAATLVLAPGDGAFSCPNGDTGTCDRATEWCYEYHFEGYCRPLGMQCGGPPGGADAAGVYDDAGRCVQQAFAWDSASCDGGLPRCGCATLFSCGCTDDEAGGVTVSCGSCYGAPPARLERLARVDPHGASSPCSRSLL